ncbi:MAG TPA: hypothetical protein VKF62_06845, partial [Planctomycetota bacterium]|nr:hypothetical protein [Planctomycetota bacterium]
MSLSRLRLRSSSLLLPLSFLLLGGEVSAQGKKKPSASAPAKRASIDWRPGEWESVLGEAAIRNVPVLLAFVPPEVGLLRELQNRLYKDDRFLAAADCVCVLAVDAEHKPREGGDPTKCAEFPTVTCSDHVKILKELFPQFAKDGVMRLPLHVLLSPDGKERERVETNPVSDGGAARDKQIVAVTQAAVSAAGKGLERPLFVRFSQELPDAERALERNELGPAYASFREIAAMVKVGPFLQRARTGLGEIETRANALLAAAAEQEAAGDVTGAYDAYVAIERDLAGTPQERTAMAARTKLERGPKTRDAIALHRRTREAEDLLREARDLGRKGDLAKATKLLERIVREFGD